MKSFLPINSYLSINSSFILTLILRLILAISEVPLSSSHPILIVISFDGFRNDYINTSLTPNLYKLSQNGVKGYMKSTFVTKTYPNHQSIATGYYQSIHGIINNKMFDPVFNETFDVDKSADKWWNSSLLTPVWIANQLFDSENRFSGSMQWPGSHVHYKNQTIKYLQEFDDKKTWNQRIDKLIEWLTMPIQSANCLFVYFEDPDETSHEWGPFSSQVMDQVRRADDTIGYLLDSLETKRLLKRTNLIIVSDHGMAEVRNDRVINLDQFLNKTWYDIYGASPVWSILPKPDFYEPVLNTLKTASQTMNFSVYQKDEIPEEYNYRWNRRILPIFIIADEGWDIYQNMTWTPLGKTVWGNHGYNNSLPSMRPLFIASGPAFKRQYNHEKPFLNIDLYPLMLNILQTFPINQFPSNGSLNNVFDMLVPPLYAQDYDESSQKWFNFILFIFGGFGLLFFGSFCFVCIASVGRIVRKPKPQDIVWDSLGSGLDIDLSSHLGPNENNFNNHFNDEVITKAKRLQKPEEAYLLLEDDDEEDQ